MNSNAFKAILSALVGAVLSFIIVNTLTASKILDVAEPVYWFLWITAILTALIYSKISKKQTPQKELETEQERINRQREAQEREWIRQKQEAEKAEIERRKREEQEEIERRKRADEEERAFWNSPEGRRVRAEQMTSEIRRQERQEAEETATRLAEAEHRRQQEAWKAIKDI